MTYELSEGALSTIMSGGQVDAPTMQILGSKKISGAGDNERYRLLVSDGLHVNSFAMLATQLNDMIRNGSLSDNSIIKIVRFITSIVPNTGKGEKRVMIILDVEVLVPGAEVGHRIGTPTPLSADGQVPNGQAPSRPAPAAPPSPVKPNPTPTPQPPSNPAPNPAGYGGNYGNNIRSPARNNRGMGGMGAGAANMDLTLGASTHPIASLTPYQNRWVIKARVTGKTPVRSWSNSKGEGKLFSFDLVDETGEIRCTAFRDQVDKFYDLLEVNKVYLVSRCQLKTANRKYSALNNDYEMTLNAESQILPVTEEDSAIPQVKYNFVPLAGIENMESGAAVDVIGVAKTTSDVVTIIAKASGKELKKREVSLVDESGTAVSLTLWGQQAEEFDGNGEPVVAVKGGRINEFGGGKSVSVNATLMVNPDIEEAHRLRGWYDHVGATKDFRSISQRTGAGGGSDGKMITLKEAVDQGLGEGDKADYFSCKATVLLIKSENAMYMACQSEGCNKKVVDLMNGFYRCEKCNKENPGFNPRLLITANIGDWSNHSWVTMFQESAEALLGHTAQEMQDLKENSPEMYLQVFQAATFKPFNFRLRAQVQIFSDEKRMKMNVASLRPIDHKAYSKTLLAELKELTGMGSVNH